MRERKAPLQKLQELITEKAATPVAGEAPEITPQPALPEPENDKPSMPALVQVHESKLLYRGILNYTVLGSLPQELSTMQVMLVVSEDTSDKRRRFRIDLYEREEVKQCVFEIANLFYVSEAVAQNDLLKLTDALEAYRDTLVQAQFHIRQVERNPMVATKEKDTIDYLSKPDLMQRTGKLLQNAGITGHEGIRLLLYIIGMSYKSDSPLHIGIEGNQSMAKRLIHNIGKCLLGEDTLMLSSVSGKSFYHATHNELMGKIMLLPNGLNDKKAAEALKQLQEGETLSIATTVKDKLSNMVSSFIKVQGHFSSIMYVGTRQGIEHIMVTGIQSNTEDIIQYNNKRLSGLVDTEREKASIELLQNIVRCIKGIEVVNPYAEKIVLPAQEDVVVVLNSAYQSLVRMVCLFHQYQRKRNERGQLLAELQDLRMAFDLLFVAKVVGSDELEPQVRNFYEQVKAFAKAQAKDKVSEYYFTMLELRQHLKVTKNYAFRYMQQLSELEFVEKKGYPNKGFKYRVVFWDDAEKVKATIKDEIYNQLAQLETGQKTEKRRTQEPKSQGQKSHKSHINKGTHKIYSRGLRDENSQEGAYAHMLNDRKDNKYKTKKK